MSWLASKTPWGKLKKLGVVGLNQRNAEFIMNYNERRIYPLVDNKITTKKLAVERGIPVPELYGHIRLEHQSRQLKTLLDQHQQFVIKPARGSGGKTAEYRKAQR